MSADTKQTKRWRTIGCGYAGLADTWSQDYAVNSEEHERFRWLVDKMDVEPFLTQYPVPLSERGPRVPVVRRLRKALASLELGAPARDGDADAYCDCWDAGMEADRRFDHDIPRHYFLQHDPADGDDVRVTIIDDVPFRGLERCRSACCAILNRKRQWTLGRDMRVFVARTVWATRWHQKWSEAQSDTDGKRGAAQTKKLRVSE